MKRDKGRILSSDLSDLISKFSQENIIAEIEKRYQSAPTKLLPISQIDDCDYVSKVGIPDETKEYFASRLKEKGFYNPLVVRSKADGRYELILGRKRFYGALTAGMVNLPCAFADVGNEEMLLMLLADTRDQREANVVEMALVCKALEDEFGYTQKTLADLSHQSRSQITNILRILKLPEFLQDAICLGRISYGHGRALASLDQEQAAALGKRVLEEKLSVREVEALAKNVSGNAHGKRHPFHVDDGGLELRITFESREDLEEFRRKKKI